MWKNAADQIKSIHAMMDSGHRSVRLERHTLILWGVTGALLIVLMQHLFPVGNFAVKWHHTLLVNSINIVVLVAVAIVDFRLTRRNRAERDETVSFVQQQLTKVWWSIVALIILIQIGMSFFGGSYLFFAMLLSLLGFAFYIHGLFSQQLLSWAGAIIILLGLTCIALRIPIVTQEWLTVMVLGIGLPALGYLIHHPHHNRNAVNRVVGFTVWLILIVLPAMAVDRWQRDYKVPNVPVISLQDYQRGIGKDNETQIVRLPANTVVPLALTVDGSILDKNNPTVIPLQLSKSVDLILNNNKPNGWYRIANKQWHNKRFAYRIKNIQLSSLVTRADGPAIKVKLFISTDQ